MNAMHPAPLSSLASSSGPEVRATSGIRRASASALIRWTTSRPLITGISESTIWENDPHHRQAVFSGRRDENHVAVHLEQFGSGVADHPIIVDDREGFWTRFVHRGVSMTHRNFPRNDPAQIGRTNG
jgi:hypothetical protein